MTSKPSSAEGPASRGADAVDAFAKEVVRSIGVEPAQWDPERVMQDFQLDGEVVDKLTPYFANAGYELSAGTLVHRYTKKIERPVTVARRGDEAVYLIDIDYRVLGDPQESNLHAVTAFTPLLPREGTVRVFSIPLSEPRLVFDKVLSDWAQANPAVDMEFVSWVQLSDALSEQSASDVYELLRIDTTPAPDVAAVVGEGEDAGSGGVIFISYSHEDAAVFLRAKAHLSALTLGEANLRIWSDEDIEAGEEWREEISRALHEASAAVLLLSADFMNSKFIRNDELPHLLQAAEEGLQIFWVKADHVDVPPIIGQYLAALPPDEVLADDPTKLEARLAEMTATVRARLTGDD